jgi:P4 family phage/plasmid primase-like protien
MTEIYSYIKWGKSLDTAIYYGGKSLRILGSYSRKLPLEGEFPYYRVYKNKSYSELTIEDLLNTSFRTEIEDEEVSKIMSHQPEHVINEEELENHDDIISAYIEEIKPNFPNNHLDIYKIKKIFYPQNLLPSFVVQLKDKWCPFKQGQHRRQTSPMYIFINKFGSCLRCYDEDCSSSRFPEKMIKLNTTIRKKWYSLIEDDVNLNIKEEEIPEGYELGEEITDRIEHSISGSHFDLSSLVYFIYNNRFRVDECGGRCTWYEFKNHRFHSNSNHLGILLSSDLTYYFKQYKKEICGGKNVSIDSLVDKLKNLTYKNNILTESSNLFYHYHGTFLEEIDSKRNLICFTNGVYDLETDVFRDGKIEDYITLSTKNTYEEYDFKNPRIKEVIKFLESLFPDPDVLDYQIKKLAYCLSGRNQEEFNIWTGNGCHAAGTEVIMFDGSFKKVEDICISDLLMGYDNTPRKVMELHRGFSDMYRVTPFKGDSFVVNGDHNLIVKTPKKNSVYTCKNIIGKFSFNYPFPVLSNIKYHGEINHNLYEKVIINMRDYLKLDENVKSKLKIFRLDKLENEIDFNFKVQKIEENNYYGFELNGDKLFFTKDFTAHVNSNGKSKLCSLIQVAFGDYWTEMPVALLTKGRNSSSAPSPEVMDLKGRRIVTIQEPEVRDNLNMGIVKQYTGGDNVSARQLHKKQEKFSLQAKYFLCCNAIPKIQCSDGGTWRRIKIVEFSSKFVDNPKRDHEFDKDLDLDRKINTWGTAFLSILVHYYKKIKLEGNKEPLSVKEYTSDFRKDSDFFAQFVEDTLIEDKDSITPFGDVFVEFERWCESSNIRTKLYTKTEIKKLLDDIFGKEKVYQIDNDYKKGYRLNIKNNFLDDSD